METKTIAKVNNQSILVIEKVIQRKINTYSPDLPTLSELTSKEQRQRISRDEILSSTGLYDKGSWSRWKRPRNGMFAT